MGLLDPGEGVDEILLARRHGHRYSRPSWTCQADGQPWPCETAQAELLSHFWPKLTQLRITMGFFLADMWTDRPDVPAAAAREQLMGWVPTSGGRA
jgi:hypothetical protein